MIEEVFDKATAFNINDPRVMFEELPLYLTIRRKPLRVNFNRFGFTSSYTLNYEIWRGNEKLGKCKFRSMFDDTGRWIKYEFWADDSLHRYWHITDNADGFIGGEDEIVADYARLLRTAKSTEGIKPKKHILREESAPPPVDDLPFKEIRLNNRGLPNGV